MLHKFSAHAVLRKVRANTGTQKCSGGERLDGSGNDVNQALPIDFIDCSRDAEWASLPTNFPKANRRPFH